MDIRTSVPSKIAIFSRDFRSIIGEGGGIDRCQLRLARYFGRTGYSVDAVVMETSDWLETVADENISFVVLERDSTARAKWGVFRRAARRWPAFFRPFGTRYKIPSSFLYLRSMVDYLERVAPDMLISAGNWENIAWSMAKYLCESPARLVVTQRTHLSSQLHDPRHQLPPYRRDMHALLQRWYPKADHVIALNEAMAHDLETVGAFPHGTVEVIPDPVVDSDIDARCNEELSHPWAKEDVPLLVSVGRLAKVKDHMTLIEAVRRAGAVKELRLIIVGDGPQRHSLKQAIRDKGLSHCVDLIGYDGNPFRYLSRADLFILPSRYEGFGDVIAEALACGCPVISTDCPSGPREILNNGRYGRLVPVGEPSAMAEAIVEMLEQEHDRELLKARGRFYSVEAAAEQYLGLLS